MPFHELDRGLDQIIFAVMFDEMIVHCDGYAFHAGVHVLVFQAGNEPVPAGHFDSLPVIATSLAFEQERDDIAVLDAEIGLIRVIMI